VLVLAFAGMTSVCPCVSARPAQPAKSQPRPDNPSAAGCPKCQHSTPAPEAQHETPPARHDCPHCQAAKKLDRTFEKAASHLPPMLLLGLPAPVELAHLLVSHPSFAAIDITESPPLLQDLFHRSCLLTL